MSRPKIRAAMRARGYNYRAFALAMGVTSGTVHNWISGKTEEIWSEYVPSICDKLGLSLEDLENEPRTLSRDESESREESEVLVLDCQEEEDPMELSRRKAAVSLLTAAGITFLPHSTTLSAPILAPDEYLAQAMDAIDTCWTFASQGNYSKVARTLNVHVPTLVQYVNTPSEHQKEAAELAVQATIQQMMLANHSLDYVGRKRLGADAVRFGRISGNPLYLATALYWHADTFIYCYCQPQKAIALFNEALKVLGNDASLNKSSLYNGLSIAHAMINDRTYAKENEKLALHYAKLARDAMPTNPEFDPLYQCIRQGTAELDQFEARTHLFLAKRFTGTDYGKRAYRLFSNSLEKQAVSVGYRCQALYRKADACIILNEMNEFEESLRSGFDMASRVGHQGHLNRIQEVVANIPPSWQGEKLIQTLRDDISQVPIVVARR